MEKAKLPIKNVLKLLSPANQLSKEKAVNSEF